MELRGHRYNDKVRALELHGSDAFKVSYDHLGSELDEIQVGWNGTYEELFESSERKSKLLKLFYDSTSDLLVQEEDMEEYF